MKKIIGKLLLIFIPIIIAIILLLPTFNSYRYETLEKSMDKETFEKEYGEAFKSAKKNRLKLGLDLRGGMYVLLEVDILDMLTNKVKEENRDPIFKEVMDSAMAEAKYSEESALDIFMKYFGKIATPRGKKLRNYFEFIEQGNIIEDSVQIIKELKNLEESALNSAKTVLETRINTYGVEEANILQESGSRRIIVEYPGVIDTNQMQSLIQTQAKLEFKLVRQDANLIRSFKEINKKLKEEAALIASGQMPQDTSLTDTTSNKTDTSLTTQTTNKADTLAQADTVAKDSAALAEEKARKDSIKAARNQDINRFKDPNEYPFTYLFDAFYSKNEDDAGGLVDWDADKFEDGIYSFRIYENDLKTLWKLLDKQEVKKILPPDIRIYKSSKPFDIKKRKDERADEKIYEILAVQTDVLLTGDVITSARVEPRGEKNYVVTMSMNDAGTETWGEVTKANIGKRIAILLDDVIYSAPVVKSAILQGNSEISGMKDYEEAKLLKTVLEAGALRARLVPKYSLVVGPSLGEDSIRSGLFASAIALILVILFMLIYYNFGGLIADLALFINMLLIIGVLAAFKGTLTLPGIAGLILTIGMAVDANILIFERIREELFKGRSIRSAIDEGFKKALPAILDSNITTFITGLILYFLGTGPIKGFAITLMIGILGTLFTAIMVSRAMLEIRISKGATFVNFGQPKIVSQ